MTFASAEEILRGIRLGATDSDPLYMELLQLAVRYARARTDWRISSPDDRRFQDEPRSRIHNALIDACNALSRDMVRRGQDITWREQLGTDRREIGDFACHLHCILGLEAR